MEIALAELMFLCLGANCAPSLWLQELPDAVICRGSPERGAGAAGGEEGLWFGRGGVDFSVDTGARIQGGTEEGLGGLLSVSGELPVSKGPEKCHWLEGICAPSSHPGAVSSMQFEYRLSLDALV